MMELMAVAVTLVGGGGVGGAGPTAGGGGFDQGAAGGELRGERGSQLAPRVESGTVWVNTHQSAVPGQPFGGIKWSGIGVEGGPWGLLGFTEVQAIHVAK